MSTNNARSTACTDIDNLLANVVIDNKATLPALIEKSMENIAKMASHIVKRSFYNDARLSLWHSEWTSGRTAIDPGLVKRDANGLVKPSNRIAAVQMKTPPSM